MIRAPFCETETARQANREGVTVKRERFAVVVHFDGGRKAIIYLHSLSETEVKKKAAELCASMGGTKYIITNDEVSQ